MLRLLTYNVQKQMMLATPNRLTAKATNSSVLSVERTGYSERWYAKITVRTLLAVLKAAARDPMTHILVRLSIEM